MESGAYRAVRSSSGGIERLTFETLSASYRVRTARSHAV